MTLSRKSVFVLNVAYAYEGEETYGVYSSLELAERAKAALEAEQHPPGDYRYIYEITIDAPPESR